MTAPSQPVRLAHTAVTAEERAAEAILRCPFDSRKYAGMSFEQASRLGLAMIKVAARTGYWMTLPEHLIQLREILCYRRTS